MMVQFAKFISWIFLPLFIPLIALFLTMYIPSEEKDLSSPSLFFLADEIKNQLILLFFIFGTLAPGFSFILMYRRQLISTIEMDEKTERVIPLLIVFSYSLILFLLFLFKAPNGAVSYTHLTLPTNREV